MTKIQLLLVSLALAVPAVAVGACEAEDVGFQPEQTTSPPAGGSSAGGGGSGGGNGGGFNTGAAGAGATATAAGGSGATGGGDPWYSGCGGEGSCTPVVCQNKVYECANCLDDDGDTHVDSCDGQCIGPCDNNEDGLHPSIPGGNMAPCKLDCYFDGDTGSGNDDCHWDHRCDPLEPQAEKPNCAYNPDGPGVNCPDEQSPACLEFCLPLVPNGCDCFGCCELPAESGEFVFIGSENADKDPTCELSSATDPDLCHPCTPVEECYNDCGHCELCLGKTELPPDCFDPDGGAGGSGEQCPPGQQPCGLPGQDPCPPGWYCITGCCVEPPS